MRPGLLLIGDAAHTMTPAAGAGIKYAIEDAVVAANMLVERLKVGQVSLRDLAAVQRQREIPTRLIQAVGAFAQKTFIKRLLTPGHTPRPPIFFFFTPIPLLRKLVPRFLAFGLWKVRVKNPQSSSSPKLELEKSPKTRIPILSK